MAGDDDQSHPPPSVDLDYYLGSGDGPGIVITPVKLRGASNYDEWAKAVRRSLVSKFKFGFIDGSIKEPTTDNVKMKHWIAVNSMVVSWITNTVAENLRSQLEDFDIAEELWTHLRKRFCVVSGTRICYIKTAIGACKQTPTETVTEYYGRLSKLWKEFVMYSRVPRCTCGACKCNIAQQVGDIRAEDHLHYFLIGLDEPYEAIRAQLLAQVPLPSVDEAYQTVVNTESLRVKEGQAGQHVMAFKVEARTKHRFGEGEKLFCHHCNREGHSEETCYQIIGFPEWWDEKKRGGRGPGRGGRSTGGRGRGGRHSVPGSNTTVRANAVQSGLVASSSNTAAQHAVGAGTQGLASVSNEQVQQIIDLLSNKSYSKLQGNIDSRWIIDTGASNHVTGNLSILRQVRTTHNNLVELPDGKLANSNQLGLLF